MLVFAVLHHYSLFESFSKCFLFFKLQYLWQISMKNYKSYLKIKHWLMGSLLNWFIFCFVLHAALVQQWYFFWLTGIYLLLFHCLLHSSVTYLKNALKFFDSLGTYIMLQMQNYAAYWSCLLLGERDLDLDLYVVLWRSPSLERLLLELGLPELFLVSPRCYDFSIYQEMFDFLCFNQALYFWKTYLET